LGSTSQGVALPVALVAALALVIGLGALASRTSQGFISSYFQGVNREARDVAESAIVDFGNTMNREENRLLLVAGNDQIGSWTDAVHRNVCTAYNSDGTPVSGANPAAVSSSALKFVRGADWQDLVSGDSSRQFKVTGVEYLYERNDNGSPVREAFNFNTINQNPTGFDTDITVRDYALSGGTRALMRVTVVGRVNKNGRESFARVAREFEVVPKCCKRSFGGNGANAWGRDTTSCPVTDSSGANGIIGGLNGGLPTGSNNTLDVLDQDGNPVTQALCWAGNSDTGISDLNGTPSQSCLSGNQALGAASRNRAGISFLPEEFNLQLPPLPSSVSVMPPLSISGNSVIYFDPNYVENGVVTPSVLLKTGNSSLSLNNHCQASPGQVDCLFTSLNVGSRELSIDSSNTSFNFHFASGGSPDYMASSGSGSYVLSNCGPASTPGQCTSPISLANFLAQPDGFNAFTLGSGTFDIRGGSSIAGMNIYAPNATVILRGGGNASPNFMGRIWTNSIDLRGNISIRTLTSSPAFCAITGNCPESGIGLFDVVVRSFSHASGF
jgi:hypothetical protein